MKEISMKKWGSRQFHRSSYFSISSPSFLVLLLLTPLIIFSCTLSPQKYFTSRFPSSLIDWKPFGFLSSYSNLNDSLKDDDQSIDINMSDNSLILSRSLHHKLRKEIVLKHELSNAERRGFVSSGIHKMYSKSESVEAILAKARFSIREAARNRSLIVSSDDINEQNHHEDYIPNGPIYRNANAFYRSYQEMEKVFKIYVYEEGEAPIFHNGPCRSIYSTEGRFINEMETGRHYRTKDPEEAHVYFMPFSIVVMVKYLYEPGSIDMHPIGNTVADYVETISRKHPFWNRSLGADHFMLSCHDWGPHSSSYVPLLFNNSIRVLCNANTSEGFNPLKDAALPEINLKTGEITGLLGGSMPTERSILAFFAGGLHGNIRHLLLNQWKEKDPDIRVYEKLPSNLSYESMLKNSKFCLCPSGYEVASPRIVEAIYSECVPVLISDGYVPPFSDVLNWKKFSVIVRVEDIPNIKKILMNISEAKYLKMQRRVKQVQRHFVINGPPKKFDLFHMIVHSVWLRRLNIKLNKGDSLYD